MIGGILDEAKALINGDRQKDYGSPEDNFEKIASYWSIYKDVKFSKLDVCVMEILLKIARGSGVEYTKDTLVDIAGYAGIAGEFLEKGMS